MTLSPPKHFVLRLSFPKIRPQYRIVVSLDLWRVWPKATSMSQKQEAKTSVLVYTYAMYRSCRQPLRYSSSWAFWPRNGERESSIRRTAARKCRRIAPKGGFLAGLRRLEGAMVLDLSSWSLMLCGSTAWVGHCWMNDGDHGTRLLAMSTVCELMGTTRKEL